MNMNRMKATYNLQNSIIDNDDIKNGDIELND